MEAPVATVLAFLLVFPEQRPPDFSLLLPFIRVGYSHIPRRNCSLPNTFHYLPRCAFFSTTPFPCHNFKLFALRHQPFIVVLLTQIDCVGFSTFLSQYRMAFSLHRLSHQQVAPRGSPKTLGAKPISSASSWRIAKVSRTQSCVSSDSTRITFLFGPALAS